MSTDIATPVEKRTCTTSPTLSPAAPSSPAIDEAMEQVKHDSREDAEVYLDEVVAPYGGE